MAVDWVATSQEQADLVVNVAHEVANAPDASDLTIERASRLYQNGGIRSPGLDQIIERMSKLDWDVSLISVLIQSRNRLRKLRGLAPVQLALDGDGAQ
jgi:hypothetical protein